MHLEKDWVFLLQASNEIEADIVLSLLQHSGVPAKKMYRSAAAGLRTVMGQALDVDLYVPSELLREAHRVLEEKKEYFT